MGVGAVAQSFCRVCGTGHSGPAACPGDLRATGAERPGWRVNVETPFGHEAIGVLLAPSHDQWVARIITFPNVLWSAPGGRGALKFVGDTRAEAEAQAIAFVEKHLLARNLLRRDGLEPVSVARPAASPNVNRTLSAAEPRKLRVIPVRFGFDKVISRGMTFNVSTEGMFVRFPTPVDSGNSLLIHLEINSHTLPLHGLVMWNRWQAEPGRPPGMGIRLSDPPQVYQEFVTRLP
jgi:hypothetical protein